MKGNKLGKTYISIFILSYVNIIEINLNLETIFDFYNILNFIILSDYYYYY